MKYDVLVERVNQILASYTVPLTLRQVYYRLAAAGLIANTRSDNRVKQHRVIKKQSQLSLV